MFIGDIAAGVVSMRFGAKGPNFATQSACATSSHAIGEACRHVSYGDADVMIAGGSEAAVSPMAMGGFANMQALSGATIHRLRPAVRSTPRVTGSCSAKGRES